MENISVIIKEPGKKAYAKEIPNTLESLKEIVGGHIESVTVSSDMVIICNEEGLYLNLPYNCSFCNIDFCRNYYLLWFSWRGARRCSS